MRHAFQRFGVAFVFLALCGCSATVRIPGEALRSKPMTYGKIGRLLEKEAQVADIYDVDFQRDSTGSKLFIGFSFRQGNMRAYRNAIVTAAGITIVQGFPGVWFDDLAKPSFWLEGGTGQYDGEGRLFWHNENEHLILKNGSTIPSGSVSFGGVLGGDYVMLKFKDKPNWIVSKLENPQEMLLELPTDLDFPFCSYANAGEFIIFVNWKHAHEGSHVSCLIYKETPGGYRLSEEIPMPWASEVYDLNATTGDALMKGNAQKFAGYYRFNIWTKHRVWLGFAPSDVVLFLKEDVVRTLDNAIDNSK